jgi:rhodanese-related sulfurtransferase
MADTAASTIGREKRTSPVLAHPDVESFVTAALTGLQPYPDYYTHMGPINLAGPEPMPDTPISHFAVAEVPDGAYVVDIRPQALYAAGHLPGSYGLELEDQMGVWAGWLIPFDARIVLVTTEIRTAEPAVVQLARIGFDRVIGIVTNLGDAEHLRSYRQASPEELRDALAAGEPQVLDVRAPGEWATGSIPGAVHCYVPDLRTGIPDSLDPSRPVWVVCGGGYRSQMAVVYLEAAGFAPVVVAGGGVENVLSDPQA